MTVYLLAGGGTAGHVNPMLAIARRLRLHDSSCEILMLGTAEGLEARLVPEAGFELLTIAKVPFPRRPNWAAVNFVPRWYRAVRDVVALIRERKVDVVIGVGGYAAAPAYSAARSAKVPLVIHEANARPGLANRLGARWTRFVGVAIEGTPLRHARLVGMPLRAEFEKSVTDSQRQAAKKSFGFDPTKPVVVVTGGSLGARRINETIAAIAPDFERAGVQILHLTGRQKSMMDSVVRQSPDDVLKNTSYVALEYCDRMRDALASADLIVSRAGASTVCEIAALGLPAVFVPYPVGNGEQRFNAVPLVNAGAAVLVADADFTPDWVRYNVLSLVQDSTRLRNMARLSSTCGIRDGAERMCALIGEARAEARSARTLG